MHNPQEAPTDTEQVMRLHQGGKLEIRSRVPVRTRDDLSRAYTPGVAQVCLAIADDPERVYELTIKQNTVAIVTDGTAVLGLGDIGPQAALPVMEGKAILFKEFADLDAFPICLDTTDTDEIVDAVTWLAPTFGAVNLEDIAAPRCFEIERRLQQRLGIPVFHDDQHGTAIVVDAALRNALRIVGKDMESISVVVAGAGAAGVAISDTLHQAGVPDVAVCDRRGVVHAGRDDLNEVKRALADRTTSQRRGSIAEALQGADVFIGVSGPGVVDGAAIAQMAPDAIVFALANPDPEVPLADARRHAAIVASGRSDQPNQINNVLAFPGVIRGAIDARARSITPAMKTAAALAIADAVDGLDPECIVPSVFDPNVAQAVSAAVAQAVDADNRRA